jgi:hypothetical protein
LREKINAVIDAAAKVFFGVIRIIVQAAPIGARPRISGGNSWNTKTLVIASKLLLVGEWLRLCRQ